MLKKSRDKLHTEVEDRDGYRLVAVRGRLTIDTSPQLVDIFRRAMKQTAKLKVDLHEVAYLDSSGISVLIQGLKMAQRRSVDFVLLDPSPKVKSIIELSQLQNFFTIESASTVP